MRILLCCTILYCFCTLPLATVEAKAPTQDSPASTVQPIKSTGTTKLAQQPSFAPSKNIGSDPLPPDADGSGRPGGSLGQHTNAFLPWKQKRFWWSLELGGFSYNYDLSDESALNFDLSGVALTGHFGYARGFWKYSGYLLLGFSSGNDEGGIFAFGGNIGIIPFSYLTVEAGISVNMITSKQLVNTVTQIPLELGATLRFPIRTIAIGFRFNMGYALDTSSSTGALIIRGSLVLERL